MQALRELLSRIQWDKGFGQGRFEIGYYDRIEDRIIRIPFENLILEPGETFAFEAIDPAGTRRTIPFHRVREVYKDGVRIWHRKPAGAR